MSAKLDNDDRCAVDILLERNQTGSIDCFTQAATPELRQRLEKVEQLLHTLDLHKVSEPPATLLAQTMARIDAAAKHGAHPHARQIQPDPVGVTRPHA